MNEELKTQTVPREVPELITRLKRTYEKLSPEKQVVFGVLTSYIYLVLLLSPESLPERVQPVVEFINKLPSGNMSLWIGTLIAMIGSVDGVRRMITDRLPFYKAYVQVFLLHKFDEEQESDL